MCGSPSRSRTSGMVRPTGPASFVDVAPSTAPAAAFSVTPPTWAPASNETVHATAALGEDALREAGVTVTVSGSSRRAVSFAGGPQAAGEARVSSWTAQAGRLRLLGLL